jgi:prefoldin subunit 5
VQERRILGSEAAVSTFDFDIQEIAEALDELDRRSAETDREIEQIKQNGVELEERAERIERRLDLAAG